MLPLSPVQSEPYILRPSFWLISSSPRLAVPMGCRSNPPVHPSCIVFSASAFSRVSIRKICTWDIGRPFRQRRKSPCILHTRGEGAGPLVLAPFVSEFLIFLFFPLSCDGAGEAH